MQIFSSVLTNVLASLYQEFFSALVFAFLFMFLYMFAQQNGGYKRAIKIFFINFQKHKSYRYIFYFAFYCAMILFRTLLCRQLWVDPLNNVLGSWSLYDSQGHIQTEGIENFILCIPFTILYFWMISQMKKYKTRWILVHSITYSFLFSICIELLQLLFWIFEPGVYYSSFPCTLSMKFMMISLYLMQKTRRPRATTATIPTPR